MSRQQTQVGKADVDCGLRTDEVDYVVTGPPFCFRLRRFSQLKSLNLSHNRLGVFPECVCEILTLTELNLSCNNLKTVPVQTGNLQRCSKVTRMTLKIHHLFSLLFNSTRSNK